MTAPRRTFPARVVRALLQLYPTSFRARFGREVEQVVRASWQDRSHTDNALAFWMGIVADVAAGAARERVAAAREWRRSRHRRRLSRIHSSSHTPSPQGDGMGTLAQDLRYAWRTVRKNPGFALVVIVSLALGIGANSLIYSVVDGIVLRPFPYPDADRLVAIGATYPALSGERTFIEAISPPEYNDIKTGMKSLDRVFAFDLGNRNISGGDQPERVFTGFIWGDPMASIGVRPLLGRSFRPDETTTRGDAVAILSHRIWQSRFGGDSAIIGKSIRINGQPTDVIGVMPPGFLIAGTDLWVPMGMDPSTVPRQARQWTVIGRLRDGATLAEANVEIKALAGRIEREYGRERKEYAGFRLEVDTWTNAVVGEFRPAANILLGAVALVLLIACANIASLLLARATARQRELAVRRALGAGRFRIARQLLTESVLLAIVGGGVGLAAAYALLGPTSGLFPEQLRSAGVSATINGRVLLYTLGIAVASGLLFGVAPALQGFRGGGREWLTGEGAAGRLTTSAGGRRVRNAFVVAEIALSLMLLVGAGVLLRSFARLQGVDPGFDTKNVLTMRLSLPREQYKSNAVGIFFEEVSRRLTAVPGVRAAGATTQFPPMNGFGTQLTVDGQSNTSEQLPVVDITNVAGDYFTSLGYALRAGRLFATTDDDKSPRSRSSTRPRRASTSAARALSAAASCSENPRRRDSSRSSAWWATFGTGA
jgi:predicted permease